MRQNGVRTTYSLFLLSLSNSGHHQGRKICTRGCSDSDVSARLEAATPLVVGH